MAAVAAALAMTAVSPPAHAANASLCNIWCDGRDPGFAAVDRQVATAVQWSRDITLHLDDPDDMAWAAITNGSPTDEVWMDRSTDGGQTWSSGSKIGDTTIPAGRTDWRTMMFNIDYPMAQEVGVVRACGKAGDRPEIACTPWMRSTTHATDSRSAEATALAQYWSPRTGNWSDNLAGGSQGNPDGWQDANALTSLIDYMQRSGDSTYSYVIAQVYFHNIQNNYQQTLPNFTNSFLDDTGWWGLAWLRAYDYTHNATYLQIAEADSDYMSGYWDSSPGACTGGVWWNTSKQAKNAIENELYLELNAALHNHVSGDTTYLGRAQQEWSWFQASGLIKSGVVSDGLTLTRNGSGAITSCPSNGQQGWTYNQGVVLDGLAQLSIATGDRTVLTTANAIAASAISRLSTNGILTEPGTGTPDCLTTSNGVVSTLDWDTFKGVFLRNLYEFAHDTGSTAYNTFLAAQLPSISSHDSNSDAQAGYTWTGPAGQFSYACQQSALDAANATF